LRWISANVPRSVYFAYEQTNPEDSFGRIMVDHFQKNGCPILSVKSNGSLELQYRQLQKHVISNLFFNFNLNFASLPFSSFFCFIFRNSRFAKC